MNPELDAIHHFTITVADIEKSIRWYSSSFRCEVIQQEKTLAVLQFANIRLTLTLPSHEPPHFAIPRHDAATLGEIRDRLDNVRSTFVADPNGNIVEILEEN